MKFIFRAALNDIKITKFSPFGLYPHSGITLIFPLHFLQDYNNWKIHGFWDIFTKYRFLNYYLTANYETI